MLRRRSLGVYPRTRRIVEVGWLLLEILTAGAHLSRPAARQREDEADPAVTGSPWRALCPAERHRIERQKPEARRLDRGVERRRRDCQRRAPKIARQPCLARRLGGRFLGPGVSRR